MLGFRPLPFRGVPLGSAGRVLQEFAVMTPSSSLSQGTPYPSQGEINALKPVLFAGLLFGGLTAWVGIRAGVKEKGIVSAAGWFSGIGGGLIGLFNLVSLAAVGMAAADRASRTSEL